MENVNVVMDLKNRLLDIDEMEDSERITVGTGDKNEFEIKRIKGNQKSIESKIHALEKEIQTLESKH
jgi:hypothetical protein